MKKQTVTLATAAALSSFAVSALASDIRTALTDGDVDLSLRYRVENVEVDGVDKESTASTLKTRLTYTSKKANDLQLVVEFDDVHVIGDHNYNDTNGSNSDHPVVADPTGTDLNQAAIKYTGLEGTTLVLGKQRIVLGNQRYVGGVAWRQHEQTYNALTAINTSLPDTTVIYSYIDQVNHFIATNDDINTDSHILYVENKSIENHKLTGYAFLYDFVDNPAGAGSTQTLGARVDGGFANIGYALEYAQQSDYSRPSGDDGFDVEYQNIEVSYQFEPVKLLAGVEVLGSDDGAVAFQTPTATKHKFNGWADQFLGTPSVGLEDTYIGAVAKVSGVNVKVFYHEFEADEGNAEFGDEINVAIGKKIGNVNALLKFADYSADEDDATRSDTQKIWFQLATKF